MSPARTIFAITFVLFIGITIIVSSFPPGQLLLGYLSTPQTVLSIWGISLAILLEGIINGLYWAIIASIPVGLAQLALHARKPRPLAPMPVAPHLSTPPLENPLVDVRSYAVYPAKTIPRPPPSAVAKEPVRMVIQTKPVPTKVSREHTGAELAIETIEGIGLARGALLRTLGIHTVADMLRVGATERGRQRLADDLGVTSATVLKWVYRADLLIKARIVDKTQRTLVRQTSSL